MAAGILSIYLAIANTVSGAQPNQIIFSWVFAVLLCIAMPVITFGKIKGIVWRTKKQRGDLIEIIEITKAKITRVLEGNKEKAVLGWENFDSIYETEDCFYMYIDQDRGLVIPKADIVEGSADIFRKLAMNNLKKDKKGKPKFRQMAKDHHD
jgi:hypothetical protein